MKPPSADLRPRVVVVGAGISGLSAALRVREQLPGAYLTVLEASDRVGGLLRTERHGGYVIERGPDAVLRSKPAAVGMMRKLGLEAQIVGTRRAFQGAYVVCRGRLERIPKGFSLMAPLHMGPFLRSNILSPAGKLRAYLDVLMPRGGLLPSEQPPDEEALEAFVVRRFGRELYERLAQPLVGGIYGADPTLLSLDATMPRFRQAERSHRSVILGLKRDSRQEGQSADGARYGMFVSLKGGLGALPERAHESLSDCVKLSSGVKAIERRGDAFVVQTGEHGHLADWVILALAEQHAAPLLSPLDRRLGAELAVAKTGSVATVTLGYRSEQFERPLDAFGYVVPAVEQRDTLAATWMSRKWPGRAPDGKELVRVFVGGHQRPEAATWSDDRLLEAAETDMRELVGVTGAPELVRIDRWHNSMPQYLLGHRERVDALETRISRLGKVRLAGNSHHGVGIPDAIARGAAAVDTLVEANRAAS